jgi:competence protein ComEA
METIKPVLRWVAVALAAGALIFAYVAPHHADSAATPDDSPPPVASATSSAPPLAAASVSPTPNSIAVYVCGAIRKSGVFKLSPGSRVVDAVNVAGGLTKDADPESINLAEPLTDGMKIDVPKKGAHVYDASAFDSVDRSVSSSHRTPHHRSSGRSGAHKLQPGYTLDINTATEAELTQLPGVGPGLARRIVEYREANGPFATVDDLQNVSGVGPSKFAKMESFVRV